MDCVEPCKCNNVNVKFEEYWEKMCLGCFFFFIFQYSNYVSTYRWTCYSTLEQTVLELSLLLFFVEKRPILLGSDCCTLLSSSADFYIAAFIALVMVRHLWFSLPLSSMELKRASFFSGFELTRVAGNELELISGIWWVWLVLFEHVTQMGLLRA